jgi:phage tail tape-measure protein
MRKPGLAIAIVVALVAASSPGRADDKGAVAGAATGAIVGAVVGGPIGAVIGAAVGGVVVGSATGPNAYATLQQGQTPSVLQERGLVQPARPGRTRIMQEPLTTGSVIQTTCVRDRRGNSRCRNEVVR